MAREEARGPRRRDVLAGGAATACLGGAAAEAWTLPPARAVEITEHAWIPMPDGVRLSARLFVPEGAAAAPVPAVLEYIPYRKRDAYRAHDSAWGQALASHGIAYVRLDVRGSGESEGVLVDEYDRAELADGCEAIAWIARQPWCSGAVGMRGISWGGINTLQVAAMRPPALKAIMAIGCSDDRYANDAHYVGGALAHANLQWGVGFKTVMAAPPDPAVVGEAWEAMWRQRLAATPPIVETWLRHPTFDDYWRRGSVNQDLGAITVPAYVVGGWQDPYSNPVGRLLAGLKVPRKGLIGPWGHTYPWTAEPLGLDWTFEEVRWWAQWLKGEETGIMAEPMLRAYLPYATWAETRPQAPPGRWVAEPAWPAPAIRDRAFHLTAQGLADRAGPPGHATVDGCAVVGLTKPEWIDRPPVEQSVDDAKSRVFDSAPLEDDLEILGYPVVRLRVAADRPVAKLAARVTEVTPDGRSWLATYGLKALTHRGPGAEPRPLVPGEVQAVEVALYMTGHRFRKGSRIRLALSENLWPLVWPSPEVANLTLELAGSALVLPVRPAEAAPAPFPIPVRLTPPPEPPAPAPEVVTAPVAPGRYRIELSTPPRPTTLADTGTTLARGRHEISELTEGEPNSGLWRQEATSAWSRGDWDCAVSAIVELTSTPTEFVVREAVTARKGEAVVFERRSEGRIPRRGI